MMVVEIRPRKVLLIDREQGDGGDDDIDWEAHVNHLGFDNAMIEFRSGWEIVIYDPDRDVSDILDCYATNRYRVYRDRSHPLIIN